MSDDGAFVDRDSILRVLPGAQALFDHSDRNIRQGKAFTDDEGFHSTLTITVSDDRLNEGRPTLIPSVYDGGRLPQDASIKRAVKSGQTFPSARTFAEIDTFAPFISNLMGTEFAELTRPRGEKEK